MSRSNACQSKHALFPAALKILPRVLFRRVSKYLMMKCVVYISIAVKQI